MTRLRTLVTLAAAVLVPAAATLALPVAPARAAYCGGGTGVSVLVDYGSLGGGTVTGCGGGASSASTAFRNAGIGLTPHPRQQGFVCRVQGKPADGDCMGTSAYWGFFVSDDGKGWVYASQGVYQQAVDSGDSVALVWQSRPSRRTPDSAPPASAGEAGTVASSGKTTRRPKPKPTKDPVRPTRSLPASSSAAPTPSGTPTPTRRPSRKPSPTRTTTPSASPAPTATDAGPASSPTSSPDTSPSGEVSTDATEPTSAEDGGGLPGWVAPGLVVVLALAAGGVAWARRVR